MRRKWAPRVSGRAKNYIKLTQLCSEVQVPVSGSQGFDFPDKKHEIAFRHLGAAGVDGGLRVGRFDLNLSHLVSVTRSVRKSPEHA